MADRGPRNRLRIGSNHRNIHVRGHKDKGTITTAFDMTGLNDLDRSHLARDAIDRFPQYGSRLAHLRQRLADQLIEHARYIPANGEGMTGIRNWSWKASMEHTGRL